MANRDRGGRRGELASTWPPGASSLRVDGRGLSSTLPARRDSDQQVRSGFRLSNTSHYIPTVAPNMIYDEKNERTRTFAFSDRARRIVRLLIPRSISDEVKARHETSTYHRGHSWKEECLDFPAVTLARRLIFIMFPRHTVPQRA